MGKTPDIERADIKGCGYMHERVDAMQKAIIQCELFAFVFMKSI